MDHRRQLPLDAIAARPGLVAEPQRSAATRQLSHQCPQGSGGVGDSAVFPDLSLLARLGRNCVRVHFQPDVGDSMLYDFFPMHEALRRITQRNPREPAYCETGHSVLRQTSAQGVQSRSMIMQTHLLTRQEQAGSWQQFLWQPVRRLSKGCARVTSIASA